MAHSKQPQSISYYSHNICSGEKLCKFNDCAFNELLGVIFEGYPILQGPKSFIVFDYHNLGNYRKVIIMQIILAHRHANWFCPVMCNFRDDFKNQFIALKIITNFTSIRKFVSAFLVVCVCVNQSLLWTGFTILLVLSLITELNKIFDKGSFYIFVSHNFTFKKIITIFLVWSYLHYRDMSLYFLEKSLDRWSQKRWCSITQAGVGSNISADFHSLLQTFLYCSNIFVLNTCLIEILKNHF